MSFQITRKYNDLKVDGYLKIANHGFIASNRTGALVGIEGTIDWACLPNFNSPPVFDQILDKNRGGYFTIRPQGYEDLEFIQYYKELTNILITEFTSNGKTVMKITDFIPTSEYSTIKFPEIHRLVETRSTDVKVHLEFRPTINFGRTAVTIEERKNGFIYSSDGTNVGMVSELPLRQEGNLIVGDKLVPRHTSLWSIVLAGITHLDKVEDYKSLQRLEETTEYWLKWSSMGTYNGLYGNDVNRSALILKGLFFEPTGLMVAAPTTSLPEVLGGERNWDYRYSWIRDTAYVIEALAKIGYKREATRFLYDIMDTIERERRIRTIYPITSESNVDEIELDYDGYASSRPVRIGNKASEQLQIDQYASIINAIDALSKVGGIISSSLWNFVGDTLDTLSELWAFPDSSIWEFRSEPRHYVYSKVLAWSAFQNAIDMGERENLSGPYRKWTAIAEEIKADILKNGFNKEVNSFVQYYGASETDAALLRIPLVNFLPITDKRIQGTIRKIENDLRVTGHLFKRYKNDDGLKGNDNAFLLLSFWYVEVLVKMGKINEARDVFDSLMDRANHLGLFSEEIDLTTGEQLGNFPQAMTHLGVIRSAVILNAAFRNSKKINGKIQLRAPIE